MSDVDAAVEARRWLGEHPHHHSARKGDVKRLLDALAEAEAERDDLAWRLSCFLDEVTGSRLSKTGYDVRTMVQATEEEFARYYDREYRALEARAEAAEAEQDRLEDDVEMLSKDAMKFARERDAAEAKLARIAEWAEENRDDLAHEGADARELLAILNEKNGDKA